MIKIKYLLDKLNQTEENKMTHWRKQRTSGWDLLIFFLAILTISFCFLLLARFCTGGEVAPNMEKGQTQIPGYKIAGPIYHYLPGLRYEGIVESETGYYRIYFCKDWRTLQSEWKNRYPAAKDLKVLSFVDTKRMEIWYTEDILDRLLGRFRWYKTSFEKEMENISSYKNLRKAAEQDREDLRRRRPIEDYSGSHKGNPW